MAIRRELDSKIPKVMAKPNSEEYIFKDIAKFYTQNPIAADILKQTQKVDLDSLSWVKDIEIRERLDKLRNDRYYKNDNWPPLPGIPPPPGPRPPRILPPPNDNDFFNLPSPSPPSFNFGTRYIPLAPVLPPLPCYKRSNIKDDDDDFDINFPEKKN